MFSLSLTLFHSKLDNSKFIADSCMIALATNFSLFSLSHFLTSCFLFLFLIKKSTNSYNFFLIFSQRTLSISLLHTHLLLFSFLLSFVLCDLRFYCTNFVIIFIRNTQTPIVCMGSRFLLCFSLVLDSTAFFYFTQYGRYKPK